MNQHAGQHQHGGGGQCEPHRRWMFAATLCHNAAPIQPPATQPDQHGHLAG
jgi:hypothetical protein